MSKRSPREETDIRLKTGKNIPELDLLLVKLINCLIVIDLHQISLLILTLS